MRLIDADALEDALGASDRDIYCKEWIRDAPTKLLNKGRVTHWMPLPKLPENATKQ